MVQRVSKPFYPTRREFSLGLGSGLFAAHQSLHASNLAAPVQEAASVTQAGLIMPLGPAGAWDSAQVSCPRILRLAADDWRMWYYGRDADFDPLVRLPTGRIGLCVSSDGIEWRRVDGSATGGAVMDPAGGAEHFDGAHVGVGDVHVSGDGFEMWYFGGPDRPQRLGELEFTGFPIAVGRAVSDDGLVWQRRPGPFNGAVLAPGPAGEADAFMVGWPQVIEINDGLRRLYYHSVDPATNKFFICVADSVDGGAWEKRGRVLGPGASDAFDVDGPATRHVVYRDGRFLMFYEGYRDQRARIGLAESADGLDWQRIPGPQYRGAIFAPAETASAWDAGAVGTPWIVADAHDRKLRMYYVGAGERAAGLEEHAEAEASAVHQIGMAECDGEDLTVWRRFQI